MFGGELSEVPLRMGVVLDLALALPQCFGTETEEVII